MTERKQYDANDAELKEGDHVWERTQWVDGPQRWPRQPHRLILSPFSPFLIMDWLGIGRGFCRRDVIKAERGPDGAWLEPVAPTRED